MASGLTLTGSNAGTRLPASGVDPLAFYPGLEGSMQPLGGKSAPSSRRVCAGRAGGGEAEGRSAVARSAEGQSVHTPIGTSHAQRFVGSTSAYIEKERNKRRFKHLIAAFWAMYRGGAPQRTQAAH